VGCGEGLELVVVEGRVRSRPGREHRSRYTTRALKSGLGGVGFEVFRVLGCMPGGRIVARWPYRSRPDPEGLVLRAFYFRCELVLKACPRR
jgi:hypothetical protein